jgi:hypothetical protein
MAPIPLMLDHFDLDGLGDVELAGSLEHRQELRFMQME